MVHFAPWRPGDQKYYASDIRRFSAATGWVPQVSVRQGVEALYAWLLQSRDSGAGQRLAMADVRRAS